MANETILCKGCGITLIPLMKVCPRCGVAREGLAPDEAQVAAESGDATKAIRTSVVPTNAMRQGEVYYDKGEFAPAQNFILLSPDDTKRRFPLLTGSRVSL